MIKAIIFDLNGIFLHRLTPHWYSREIVSERMFAFATELRKRGIKVFILSNNVKERLFNQKRYALIQKSADKIYYAWQTGFIKPDPRAWAHVLQDDNLKPEECLYFDDQERNVRAAEKAGIKSFIFTNEEELEKILKRYL